MERETAVSDELVHIVEVPFDDLAAFVGGEDRGPDVRGLADGRRIAEDFSGLLHRFDGGLTIGGVLGELAEAEDGWPTVQRSVEEAVIDLVAGDEESPALERVA